MKSNAIINLGANYRSKGFCHFRVWAPLRENVTLKIISPTLKDIALHKDDFGYWSCDVGNIEPGSRYMFRLDNQIDRPDPGSHYQPDGVHAASEIIDHSEFRWSDEDWRNIPLPEMIIYELHVGTFTPQGNFEGVITFLENLKELGVNTIELMPVAQFPGERNWGYDGVYPYAVQNSYGGPNALKKLVNECHRLGLAVILDVVYNHLGPEGNYLADYGPYFTDKYHTPWSQAINFDDAYSFGVRDFFIQNALYWLKYYHFDGLRLDAIHGIYDFSARHFLEELTHKIKRFSKTQKGNYYLIAESDLNDIRIIRDPKMGGYGIDAQWSDDFHHAVHTLLTGERNGYYADFGKLEHLEKSMREGFVYSGQYSEYRKRHHGNSSREIPADRFVVCIQNHDQVGNRMLGERLSQIIPFEALKLAAGTLLVSPYIPLLFMGEEYAEDNPFLYFVSHTDENLIQAVREGRKREFSHFRWKGEPPDPQSSDAFINSRLDWQKQTDGRHRAMRNYYRRLIALRKEMPALKHPDKVNLTVRSIADEKVLLLERHRMGLRVLAVMNFSDTQININSPEPRGRGLRLIDSYDQQWAGPGAISPKVVKAGDMISMGPFNFLIYEFEGIE